MSTADRRELDNIQHQLTELKTKLRTLDNRFTTESYAHRSLEKKVEQVRTDAAQLISDARAISDGLSVAIEKMEIEFDARIKKLAKQIAIKETP